MGCGTSTEAQLPNESHNEYVIKKQKQAMRNLSRHEESMYFKHMALFGGT